AQYGNCEDLGIYDLLLEPALYENMVVWTDCRNGNRDIYGLDLSTFQEFEITSHTGIQQCPALYENLVIWEDNRGGTWDIYGYDLSILPKILSVPSRTCLVRGNLYSQILLSAISIGIFSIIVKIVLDSFRFKSVPETAPWSKKASRNFKRNSISLHMYSVFTIICGVFGLLVFWRGELFGSFMMAFFVLSSGIILWNVTFPYVRTTQAEIQIYDQFPSKNTIRWDSIDRIEFDQGKKKIKLRVTTHVFRIDLFRMDLEDRDDFLTTLRYPPIEGIEFVYSTD
ncbi:MAG: hypothetical protein HXS53_05840, partial [Theionarchaea archaeon]|nr:hypothetical protein [Theionarchaea archaeon]